MDWWFKLKFRHKVIFTVLVAFGVISFWRGVWGLWDYILPNNYFLSLVLSILVGLEILLVTNHLTSSWR